jgi:CheY-like chemotaxis protein
VLRNIGCKCAEAYDGTDCLEIMKTRMLPSVSELTAPTIQSGFPAGNANGAAASVGAVDDESSDNTFDLILMDSEMPGELMSFYIIPFALFSFFFFFFF